MKLFCFSAPKKNNNNSNVFFVFLLVQSPEQNTDV